MFETRGVILDTNDKTDAFTNLHSFRGCLYCQCFTNELLTNLQKKNPKRKSARVCKFYWWVESLWLLLHKILESFWNFWSQVSQGKKPFFRLSSMWSSHVLYTLSWGIHEVAVAVSWSGKLKSMMEVIEKLPSSCFVVQYNSLILMIWLRFTTFTINVNCICCEKGKDKTVFVTENLWSRSGCLFVTKNFWSRSDYLRNLCGVIWTILV